MTKQLIYFTIYSFYEGREEVVFAGETKRIELNMV